MISITKRPNLLVNQAEIQAAITAGETPPPSVYSNWVTAFNPIVYEMQSTLSDPNLYFKISVYEYGTNMLLAVRTHKPFKVGLLMKAKVNIQSVVTSYLENTYNYVFQGHTNQREQKASIKIYIKYSEYILDEIVGSETSDEVNAIYAVSAVKQIGDVNGQNMAEYVPFNYDKEVKAKFLTAFKEPVFYYGYPFTISFIYSEQLSGVEILSVEEKRDINGQLIDTENGTLRRAEIKAINHIALTASIEDADHVTFYLKTGQPVEAGYVETGYVETGYTE